MKSTHRHKCGYEDRVYSLDKDGRTVWVKINDQPWKISAWLGDRALFREEMEKINTFKGNK